MATLVEIEKRGPFALITFDTPGRSVNTLGASALDAFERALDALEIDRELRGVVLASAKESNFLAGADLDELAAAQSDVELRARVEAGQRALVRLENLHVPTVAAIRGAALGGGLEVALACRFRVGAEDRRTVLGLPEVQLGLLPALGGTYRLPRLVGLARGLDLLLTGRRLSATEALRAGVLDEVVPPPVLLSAAFRRLEGEDSRVRRRDLLALLSSHNPLARRFVFFAVERRVARQAGSHYPAPLALLAAAREGAMGGRQAGHAVEAARFVELATGPVSRRLVEVFLASRELAAEPESTSVESAGSELAAVDRIGVLGAGFMGSGIAAVAARAGCEVRLFDSSAAALGKGYSFCSGRFVDLERRRKMSRAESRRAFHRIVPTLAEVGFDQADLVVEAVVEDLEVKRALLSRLERQISPAAILASNTSTLPIAELALGLAHPERVLGLHFFSPVHRMPLVEIVRHATTSAKAIARAQSFVRRLGKTPIVVRDGPGFYTTRILSPYLAEAGRLLLAGATVEAIDAAGRAAGFPVGPLQLLDEVGIDVAARAARTLAAAFGARMPFPEPFARLVAGGRLGRKSGRGFYDYRGRQKRPDVTTLALLGAAPERGAGALPASEISERLLFAMVVEAVRAFEEEIISSPRDGDIGAIFGLGFPPFLGGPFRLLDELGAAAAVVRLERLAAAAGPAFDPPGMLREMAVAQRSFHSSRRRGP